MAFENKVFPILLYNGVRILVRQDDDKLWETVSQHVSVTDGSWRDQEILEKKFKDRVHAMVYALDLCIEYMFSSDGQMESLEIYRKSRKKWSFK